MIPAINIPLVSGIIKYKDFNHNLSQTFLQPFYLSTTFLKPFYNHFPYCCTKVEPQPFKNIFTQHFYNIKSKVFITLWKSFSWQKYLFHPRFLKHYIATDIKQFINVYKTMGADWVISTPVSCFFSCFLFHGGWVPNLNFVQIRC